MAMPQAAETSGYITNGTQEIAWIYASASMSLSRASTCEILACNGRRAVSWMIKKRCRFPQ